MNPIFKKIKDKIEEVTKRHNLSQRDANELNSFADFYQLAAEVSPRDYKDFKDFFVKQVKNNSRLAEVEKNSLAGTPEALEIMRYFYEEETT